MQYRLKFLQVSLTEVKSITILGEGVFLKEYLDFKDLSYSRWRGTRQLRAVRVSVEHAHKIATVLRMEGTGSGQHCVLTKDLDHLQRPKTGLSQDDVNLYANLVRFCQRKNTALLW
jgi:hypothetical protein